MKTPFFFALIVGLLTGTAWCADQATQFDALLGQELSETQRLAVTEARDDFAAALRFRRPVHAVPHEFEISDGGSRRYDGRGYRITVWRGFSSFRNDRVVYVYGPQVEFDTALFPTVHISIASTAFYLPEDLREKFKAAGDKKG